MDIVLTRLIEAGVVLFGLYLIFFFISLCCNRRDIEYIEYIEYENRSPIKRSYRSEFYYDEYL